MASEAMEAEGDAEADGNAVEKDSDADGLPVKELREKGRECADV